MPEFLPSFVKNFKGILCSSKQSEKSREIRKKVIHVNAGSREVKSYPVIWNTIFFFRVSSNHRGYNGVLVFFSFSIENIGTERVNSGKERCNKRKRK